MAEWRDLQKRVTSLKNDLESKSLELKTTLGLVTEAARLRQELSEARKVIRISGAKLVSSRENKDEISAIMKSVTKLLSSVAKA